MAELNSSLNKNNSTENTNVLSTKVLIYGNIPEYKKEMDAYFSCLIKQCRLKAYQQSMFY